MPFKFNRLILLAGIFGLQFTEISEFQRSETYLRAKDLRFNQCCSLGVPWEITEVTLLIQWK